MQEARSQQRTDQLDQASADQPLPSILKHSSERLWLSQLTRVTEVSRETTDDN
jgi:hypothetical protein